MRAKFQLVRSGVNSHGLRFTAGDDNLGDLSAGKLKEAKEASQFLVIASCIALPKNHN